ncbi:helix-turn-helix domain-containing protein [Methylosinus sp. PW1]|uniref:helix-turn-helix domain-containing protein n=1 Tax=Methylosinus sp. PW1 TaxID=107636 RepID=UPI000A028C43
MANYGRFVLAAAIGLRGDYDARSLRAIAKRSKDGPQARRLLALASIYDGGARSEAAKIGGVTLQVVRDWVLRFNAGGPDGLVDRKAPGQPSRLECAGGSSICASGHSRSSASSSRNRPWASAVGACRIEKFCDPDSRPGRQQPEESAAGQISSARRSLLLSGR